MSSLEHSFLKNMRCCWRIGHKCIPTLGTSALHIFYFLLLSNLLLHVHTFFNYESLLLINIFTEINAFRVTTDNEAAAKTSTLISSTWMHQYWVLSSPVWCYHGFGKKNLPFCYVAVCFQHLLSVLELDR